MSDIRLCANFSIFPRGHNFGSDNLSYAAFEFQNGQGQPLDIITTAAVPTLHFVADLTITLPAPLSAAEVRAASMAGGDLTVTAVDDTGNAVDEQTIAVQAGLQDVHLEGPGIVALRLTGGGLENSLESVCVTIPAPAATERR